jgi:SAM-dependent methyltransferase
VKKDIEAYLQSLHDITIQTGKLPPEHSKEYIRVLPELYRSDIEFRLLFDWHFSPQGRQLSESDSHPLFQLQRYIASALGSTFDLDYQFYQFFIFHAIHDLKGKKILEIGGSLPNSMLFDLFQVGKYINNESPDYIEAESGESYSSKHGDHCNRKTIIANAEDIDQILPCNSVDAIFSVACFEHIYDLSSALRASHAVTKPGGVLYSFFAPIYSYLTDGHHGVIPQHERFAETPWGLHLMSSKDQRIFLQENGITHPKEIQDFLGKVNFDRVPNRLLYEDYSRILTESPYFVVRLDDVAANYNISKRFQVETAMVRRSNPSIGNIHSQGFRVILQKI